MADLVTLGEAMIRLSPPHFQRLEQTSVFDVCVGGSEMNIAVAAQRMGLSSALVTAVPDNPMGRMIINKTREHGVDTSFIITKPKTRAGIYYLEFGAKPRSSAVVYDRANSAIAMTGAGELPWKAAFAGARHFHTGGITPGLSDAAAAATLEGLKAAKAAGLTTSFDLNFRARLWTEEKAQKVIEPMCDLVDIMITTEEDTYRVFKIKGDNYEEVARKLADKFGFKAVAVTLRENLSVWRNNWSAIVLAGGKIYGAPTYDLEIVDRVGAGDSFSAGFLAGWLESGDYKKAVEMGVALSALKHSIPGDLNWATRDEVDKLMAGGGSLRIAR
ncbi:MAG: sugar kinase [Planctomycetes bacterium]|nr:sugar kinase [Planctomycetota bacterium]